MLRSTGGAGRRIGPSGIALIIVAPVAAVLVAFALLHTPSPPASPDGASGTSSTRKTAASPSASAGTGRPLVAFLGDSYASGIGASQRSKRWATLVSADQRWIEKNISEQGTSYSTAGESGGSSYTDRIDGVVATGANIVVVSGGRMDVDVSATQLRADVRATFSGIRAGMPEVKIIVVSPMWDDDPAPERMRGLTSIVQAEANRAGATYLDIGEPMLGYTSMVTAEGIYPNDAGHAAIATAVEKALA